MSDLLFSHKPEVLRLHQIEEQERSKFCGDFNMVLAELLPSSVLRSLRSSQLLTRLLAICPDAYYTLVTTLICRRKLGEEYTYIAMYKSKHYQQEGVLMNKKSRTLLGLLQLLSRHIIWPLFSQLLERRDQFDKTSDLLELLSKVQQCMVRYVGRADQIVANVEWIVLMLFMLNWSRRYTVIESILGISYIYTYKNEGLKDVSYKIEGYLIMATLVIKVLKQTHHIYQSRKKQREAAKKSVHLVKEFRPQLGGRDRGKIKQKVLCRICYDNMKNRSATKCGHLFCWDCIIQTLQMAEECPVCRTKCLPREVVQLRNY